jgi:defect-in-organelle-trafficking protein DotD
MAKHLTLLRDTIRQSTGMNPMIVKPTIMQILRKAALLIGSVLLVAACEKNTTIIPVATEPDIVTVKLAQAADKASAALDSIAGIEKYKNPAPPSEDYSHAPPSLMQPVTLRWSGPVELVTRTLAERAGYKFRVKGNIPAVPLSVNVDVYQQPILHVLHDIGLQAGHRADLSVDAISGVIEVAYAPADKSQ